MNNEKDMFKEMVRMQKAFQDKFGYHRPITDWIAACTAELGELWEASNGRWWKKKQEPEEKKLEEFVDVLHFILGMIVDSNWTPEQIYEMYQAKLKVNYERQDRGY